MNILNMTPDADLVLSAFAPRLRTNMKTLNVATKRGPVLNGALFADETRLADTAVIAVTGIHGNFYSNPFYYVIGDTLAAHGFAFIYAQTNDAFDRIRTPNVRTGRDDIIGSWNERFRYTDEDIAAWLDWAEQAGYRRVILAGHSLGANKVISYLSRHHEGRIAHFLLLSPANLTWMTAGVSAEEKRVIRDMAENGRGGEMLPFPYMGWVDCIADTAWDWQFSGLLDNVWTAPDGDFSQCERISHSGALLIGTYDNFTDGDPSGFLRNINDHIPTARDNRLLFIEGTGHTYQQKHQEVADAILNLARDWSE